MFRMVLDTDTYNEVDDQFALVYALLSPEAVKVEAVYAAPFHNEKSTGPGDGMERSYQEILRLMKLMGRETEGVVFRGAERYMGSKENPVQSEAVEHLITLALDATPEDPLYAVAIGAPTNISSALIIEPKIKENLKVIWLGGTVVDWPGCGEFNQQQDTAATQVLFDSGVDLVQIPCHNVASHLKVGVPELRACMGDSAIAKALTDLVAEAIDNNPARTRIIWDISAVACLVRPQTVRTYKIHSPVYHGSPRGYSFDKRRHLIDCVYFLDRDGIFIDFYNKIRKLK